MDRLEEIIAILIAQAQEMGEETGQKSLLSADRHTKLYHPEGNLDSLGLVAYISGVEEKIAEKFGIDILLADEKAMSQHSSPFLSITTMAGYIAMIFKNELPG